MNKEKIFFDYEPEDKYLSRLNLLAQDTVESPDYLDSKTGYISSVAWKRLVEGGVLSASLGEREVTTHQSEIMETLRTLSYHDINLGLTYGITTALVIKVIQKFAHSKDQANRYLNKIKNGELMGLAITEKDKSGSSALDMDSTYKINNDGTATLSFAKHLQGLSGNSGLIVAAKKADAPSTTIGLFVVDQKDIHTKLTKTMGLKRIPYGVNTASNITLNLESQMLCELPRRELFTFQNIFTESRLYFVGMPLGHQQRMENEANEYANKRVIGGILQKDIPVVDYKLKIIRARRIASEAIFNYVKNFKVDGKSLMEGSSMDFATEAIIIKALPTEYALATAADRAELMGGHAFYKDNSLQDYLNIWPFKIFEGTRWMLNTQIGHATNRKNRDNNLFNRTRAETNLSFESKIMINKIGTGKKSSVQEELFGQIESRCFALGAIDKNNLSEEDFELVTKFLNLEIQQIGLEYFSTQ